MREKLLSLLELQKVDSDIVSLRKSAEVYPKQISELEQDLQAARSAVDAERSRLTDTDQQKRTLEQNVLEEKDKVKKWEQRLAEQRSTREYSALAREIDIAKKSILTMQEESTELGKTILQLKETVKAKEGEFAGRMETIQKGITELKSKMASSRTQIAELESKRGHASASVDTNLLRRYDGIRKKKMPALVSVGAGGTCHGCRMNLPPQQYNLLRVSLGTDVCPSCNRIIYAAEAVATPQSDKS